MKAVLTTPAVPAAAPRDVVLRLFARYTRKLPDRRKVRGLAVFALWLYCYAQHRMRRGPAARPRVVATDVHDFSMRLATSDFVDLHLLFVPQFYEAEELAFVRAMLEPGDVFIDIGAHVGLYSLVAWRAVGASGRVLAIEANPETFGRLSANLAMNRASNVTAANIGVSDRCETLRLDSGTGPFAAAGSFLPGILDATPSNGRAPRTEHDVECAPLLEVLDRHGLAHIDGVKIDVEGLEYRVLSAFFRDAAPDRWPRFIVLEFHEGWVEAAGGNVLSLLQANGYVEVRRCGLNVMMVRAP